MRIQGLILNYVDARAGRSWVVDGGEAVLQVSEGRTNLSSTLSVLSGRDFVTTLALDYTSPLGQRTADISLEINDIPAGDIAMQNPALSWLSVLEAQVSASLRTSLEADGQLGPTSATLDIGEGVLNPVDGARPVGFSQAEARLEYDPTRQWIGFEQVEVTSDWGQLRAEGQAYLRDIEDGLPQSLIGQFQAVEMSLNPADLYPTALDLRDATADFRLGLRPFVADIGQLGLTLVHDGAETRIQARGRAAATSLGWDIRASADVDAVSRPALLAAWPTALAPRTRDWLDQNLLGGEAFNLAAGIQIVPGERPVWALTHEFREGNVRILRQWPSVEAAAGTLSLVENSLTVMVDAGQITPPQGGVIDVAGSVFRIPTIGIPEPPAEIAFQSQSSVTAALSLVDLPPLAFISKADLPVDMAQGRASVSGEISLPLMRNPPPDRFDYDITARLRDLSTTQLIPGRAIAASALTLDVDPDGLSISGPVRLGAASADMTWTQEFGASSSRVTAQVALNEGFLNEFNIALPPGMIRGEGQGDLTLNLRANAPPDFQLSTNTRGLRMQLPALGWGKSANTAGRLNISGSLGDVPRIDRIAIDVAGLVAEGSVQLRPGGGLERAQFSTVQLGGWLNSAVALVGRGAGRPVGVELSGGALDLRRANFGDSGGQSGPMQISLDRLRVTDDIVLRRFRGNFDGGAGLSGRFTAELGGQAPIEGILAPVEGRTGVRILSANAGAVLGAAGLLETAQGGALDLTLRPTGGAGTYDGQLAITDLRIRDAPALAALLDAISVVGLLQQLDGQGLRFTNVDARFRLTPDQIIVTQSSAVGPGLGISVDGIYTLAGKVMDFQGVVSPLYLINGIGSFLTRPGEGLFGFNFTLRGSSEQVQVGVNPLSVFTPGMFREIFRRPVPVVE